MSEAAQETPSSPPPRPSRKGWYALVIVLAAAAGGTWYVTSHTRANEPAKVAALPTDRPVLVQVVRLQPASQPRIFVGTLRARVEGDQGFRVAGKIVARSVQVGERVKSGALIATLDATDLTLQRESAVAEHIAALSSERQAQAELARIVELRRQGWSTEQALDRQKTTVDEAKGRRERAERNVELATNAQSYSELRADQDGVVTQLYVEAGQVVAAGQAIVRIARDGDREAQIAVPEHELEMARRGTAEAALWSMPDRQMPARLREISPNADPATRTFQARYLISELSADAPLGMTVTLRLTGDRQASVARIPLGAILNEGDGTHVFVVDARNELMRRPIRVQGFDAREALVQEGLADGERIVTMGVHLLRAGQKIRIAARNG